MPTRQAAGLSLHGNPLRQVGRSFPILCRPRCSCKGPALTKHESGSKRLGGRKRL
jgi:hypothetical protein